MKNSWHHGAFVVKEGNWKNSLASICSSELCAFMSPRCPTLSLFSPLISMGHPINCHTQLNLSCNTLQKSAELRKQPSKLHSSGSFIGRSYNGAWWKTHACVLENRSDCVERGQSAGQLGGIWWDRHVIRPAACHSWCPIVSSSRPNLPILKVLRLICCDFYGSSGARAIKGFWGGERVNCMPVVCYCGPEACVHELLVPLKATLESEGLLNGTKYTHKVNTSVTIYI